jgi:hypothetical protein
MSTKGAAINPALVGQTTFFKQCLMHRHFNSTRETIFIPAKMLYQTSSLAREFQSPEN